MLAYSFVTVYCTNFIIFPFVAFKFFLLVSYPSSRQLLATPLLYRFIFCLCSTMRRISHLSVCHQFGCLQCVGVLLCHPKLIILLTEMLHRDIRTKFRVVNPKLTNGQSAVCNTVCYHPMGGSY